LRNAGFGPDCDESAASRRFIAAARAAKPAAMTGPAPLAPAPAEIDATARRIAAHVRRTPLLASRAGEFGVDHALSLKLELLQHAGSFKTRGAFANLLGADIPAAGVTAASGGNHRAAVAYAAGRLGLKAKIFTPSISSPAKLAAIRGFGADLHAEGARYADAAALCAAHAAQTGALNVHPYDAPATLAGQGTLFREWEAQRAAEGGALDTALIAVGGGGLIGGACAWFGDRVKIVGVEPDGSRALHAALEAGAPVDVPVDSVAADSLGAKRIGELPFALARRAGVVATLVPDAAIVAAQRLLWRDARIAAEPGGACALAALICGAYRPAPGERVGVLVCGGNVDLSALAQVAAS
jgi:threonine dehydratase